MHLHHTGIVEDKGTCASGNQATWFDILLENHSGHGRDKVRIAKVDPSRDRLLQRCAYPEPEHRGAQEATRVRSREKVLNCDEPVRTYSPSVNRALLSPGWPMLSTE
jgi:hypothetical protein